MPRTRNQELIDTNPVLQRLAPRAVETDAGEFLLNQLYPVVLPGLEALLSEFRRRLVEDAANGLPVDLATVPVVDKKRLESIPASTDPKEQVDPRTRFHSTFSVQSLASFSSADGPESPIQVSAVESFNPIQWLAHYLREHNPNRIATDDSRGMDFSSSNIRDDMFSFYPDEEFQDIDEYASHTTPQQEFSLQILASHLTGEQSPCKSILDKTRAIFTWITTHLRGDPEYYNRRWNNTFSTTFNDDREEVSSARRSPRSGGSTSGGDRPTSVLSRRSTADDYSIDPKVVLDRRLSNSEGFANLFHRLCQLSGLISRRMDGYSRGYIRDFGFFDSESHLTVLNHSYNIVKIDGHWRFIDTFFGSGFFQWGSDSPVSQDPYERFTTTFRSFFFATPPKYFLYSHFPLESDSFQYVEQPLSLHAWGKRPIINPNFWLNGIRLIHPTTALVYDVDHDHAGRQTVASNFVQNILCPISMDVNVSIINTANTAATAFRVLHATDAGRGHSASAASTMVVNSANLIFANEVLLSARTDASGLSSSALVVGDAQQQRTGGDELCLIFLQRHDEIVNINVLFKFPGQYRVSVGAEFSAESLEHERIGDGLVRRSGTSFTVGDRCESPALGRPISQASDNDSYAAEGRIESRLSNVPGTSSSEHIILEYEVTVTKGVGTDQNTPFLYEIFDQISGHLYYPLEGVLRGPRRLLEHYPFKVGFMGVEDVAIVSEAVDEWTHLVHRRSAGPQSENVLSLDLIPDADIFEGDVDLYDGSVCMFVKLSGENRYRRVADFRVETL